MAKQIFREWTKQEEWWGNPSLGYESWAKHFTNPHTGKLVPVYVFGPPNTQKISFCVSAGANSDYSYTGCFYPNKYDFPEYMEQVDIHYNQGRLFR